MVFKGKGGRTGHYRKLTTNDKGSRDHQDATKLYGGGGESGYCNPPTSLPPCHKINDDRSFVVTIMTMIKKTMLTIIMVLTIR